MTPIFFQPRIKRGSMPKCKPLGQFYFDHLKTSQVEKFCRRMIKKSWDFFWFKIMYLRVSGNFYEVDSILERESEKKTVKTFLFYTRFSVWFLASYFDYLSRLLQFFFMILLPSPLWFLLKRVNWFEWTFLWLWKLSILGQFHFLKLSTFLFK